MTLGKKISANNQKANVAASTGGAGHSLGHKMSFTAGSKQTLTITADIIPDGVKETIRQGLLLRVEAGRELKLLALWGIETEDEVGASVVIRDGHTLKKKVSWRPSSVGGEQLNATSIVFVPAHQYGTSRADGMMWTSWYSPLERSYHQFVLFNPLNREAQRCVRFREIFQHGGVAPLYAQRSQKDAEKGVRFSYDRGCSVQPPLVSFLESTQSMYVVHQVESRGALETAVSAIVPHPPFTVTETCVVPFSWASKYVFASIRSIHDDTLGGLVVLVTERLHSVILRVGSKSGIQIGRTFRPKDFIEVSVTPADAGDVSIRWYCAEVRDHVILPEYFRDPTSEKDISEPRRFASGTIQQPTVQAAFLSKPPHPFPSSAASQRSTSLASTVPQRLGVVRGTSVESRVVVADDMSEKSYVSGGAPPAARVVLRAVEALARLQHTKLRSQYFQRWATKIVKQPNWCIDGWPVNTHTAIVIAPMTLLLDAEQPSHIVNFLQCCRAAQVELWLLYEEGLDVPPLLDRLKAIDNHHVIGQLIAVSSLREVRTARQNVYLRHVHSKRVLWIMPSVDWMLHVTPMGRSDESSTSEAFVPCSSRLFYSQRDIISSYFLHRLGELVHGCRRVHTGAFEQLWTAMNEPSLSGNLRSSKECGPNGKGFVDLLTL
ncbi:Hypothetical protein, putative [Bodo saltans]|uniref:Uncharacterized protein n=1 Tax=Bodo saltans TaxID=75058 RepID=A0A0S4JXA6_BODSA|nr:Hypothetical protein, putative [Bodo saltans]|eukprot:CUG94070.1 Hypothetical protein, putative [Bodo saltans]